MSNQEKDRSDPAESSDEELTLEQLGTVFGGWHPAPPPPSPSSDSNPPSDV